jgi:hypothetical protein
MHIKTIPVLTTIMIFREQLYLLFYIVERSNMTMQSKAARCSSVGDGRGAQSWDSKLRLHVVLALDLEIGEAGSPVCLLVVDHESLPFS